jgi:hypothetical protein
MLCVLYLMGGEVASCMADVYSGLARCGLSCGEMSGEQNVCRTVKLSQHLSTRILYIQRERERDP